MAAKNKEGRVLEYTETSVSIFFPDDNICCDLCPLMETYARKQCRRTGEYIFDSRTTGYYCPLKINEKGENNNESI